ncbi:MAG: cobalamin biosynthesis protein [Rhodospirillales bacterium]
MYTFGLSGGAGAFDSLVLLLIALALETYIGEARFLFKAGRHPAQVFHRLVAALDRKLNRESRSQADRALRGFLVVVFVVVPCAATGWGTAWLTQNHAFGWIVELVFLVMLLAQRRVYDNARAVAHALSEHGQEPARRALSKMAGRNVAHLDEHGVARATIERVAENICAGAVAPVFWYVLLGFPGILVYKAVNFMDAMIGQSTPRYRAFGMTAAGLDDALSLIPARLAGLFIVLAAVIVPTARPGRAWKVMLRDAGKHRTFNAGWPAGAMAGALDLALAGPRRYAERTVKAPWIGGGSARATDRDIGRALHVYVIACLINALGVAAIASVRLGVQG